MSGKDENFPQSIEAQSDLTGFATEESAKRFGLAILTDSEDRTGILVHGNASNSARAVVAGEDFIFRQRVGVYGESRQQGVMGHGTADDATGVFGNSTGTGFGVRRESGE